VGEGRLELPTLRLSGVRSNHLSYSPGSLRSAVLNRVRHRGRRGSNALPHGKADGPRSLETEAYVKRGEASLYRSLRRDPFWWVALHGVSDLVARPRLT
jgi:hypothetical protein